LKIKTHPANISFYEAMPKKHSVFFRGDLYPRPKGPGFTSRKIKI
jgi:hypothetical protein